MAFDSTNNRMYRHGGLGYYSNVGVEVDMQDLWCDTKTAAPCCDSTHLRTNLSQGPRSDDEPMGAALQRQIQHAPALLCCRIQRQFGAATHLFLTLPNCTACDTGCAHPARRGVSQWQAVGVWRHRFCWASQRRCVCAHCLQFPDYCALSDLFSYSLTPSPGHWSFVSTGTTRVYLTRWQFAR